MPHSHNSNKQQIRLLHEGDIYAIERLFRTSEYIYQRFTLSELPLLLRRYPAVGMFHDTSLYGFLVTQVLTRPCAWIGGFGVSWTESKAHGSILSTLLEEIQQPLLMRGARHLYYSGNDAERDWLRSLLLPRGFIPYRRLYSYDKYDYSIPTEGNMQVRIRQVRMPATSKEAERDDMGALLRIEEACFEDLWRYDSAAFQDIEATHPYFVVAELNGEVVGYQFNAVDDEYGYFVRIAVHPSASGQGIGARLLTEAIKYFQRARVSRIMLNTQAENTHAHRLYQWFGFVRLQQMGFVLNKAL